MTPVYVRSCHWPIQSGVLLVLRLAKHVFSPSRPRFKALLRRPVPAAVVDLLELIRTIVMRVGSLPF